MPDNEQIIVANGELRRLISDVAVLGNKVDNIEGKLNQMGPWQCPVHAEQISRMKEDVSELKADNAAIKDTIGKRNVLSGVISLSVAATVAFLAKMLGD